MFDKLMKLANDLDSLGRFEEADMVDDIIKAVAAGEMDPPEDELPVPEDMGTEVAPVNPTPGQDDAAQMRAELEKLRQENEALKLKKMRATPSGGIKVSPKGAVSVYGLGKWPITLYKSQWTRLLDMKEKILQFITENDKMLKSKEE